MFFGLACCFIGIFFFVARVSQLFPENHDWGVLRVSVQVLRKVKVGNINKYTTIQRSSISNLNHQEFQRPIQAAFCKYFWIYDSHRKNSSKKISSNSVQLQKMTRYAHKNELVNQIKITDTLTEKRNNVKATKRWVMLMTPICGDTTFHYVVLIK